MTTSEPTVHTQIEIPGPDGPVLVDEGIYLLLTYVWNRGLKTRSSCEGSGPTPRTDLPYIVFPEVDDGIEFLRHTAIITDYRYGEQVGLNIVHPLIDVGGPPEGKIAWMPRLTLILTKAWGES